MTDDHIGPIAALLTRAEEAHATYERNELGGVYDRAWPRWYATYIDDHGLSELIGQPVSVDRLAELLEAGFAEFEREGSDAGDSWQSYLARRIAAKSKGE